MFSKTNVKETLQQFSCSVLMFAIKRSWETYFLNVFSPSYPHSVNFVASTVVMSRLPSMHTVCKKRWTPNLLHFSSAFHQFELFLLTCQRKSATYRKHFLWYHVAHRCLYPAPVPVHLSLFLQHFNEIKIYWYALGNYNVVGSSSV